MICQASVRAAYEYVRVIATSNGAAIDTLSVQLSKRAGDAIKACSEDQDVELNRHLARPDAFLRNLFNRVLVDIDNVDVILIHDFIEALPQRWTFSASWMWWHLRCQ